METELNRLQLREVADYLQDLSKASAIAVFTTQFFVATFTLINFTTLLVATILFFIVSLRLYKQLGRKNVYRN